MSLFRAGLEISLRKEVVVIFAVVITLLILPIISITSLTDVAALADTTLHLYQGPASTTNTYDYGYCTFWVAKRREEMGIPIPNTWGDAYAWDDHAKDMGYTVDRVASPGAIMETDAGALGHVAIVESVGRDGGWTISEMNAKDWDVVDFRTLAPSQANEYNFIH